MPKVEISNEYRTVPTVAEKEARERRAYSAFIGGIRALANSKVAHKAEQRKTAAHNAATQMHIKGVSPR